MIAAYLKSNIPVKDKEFDLIYPIHLRKLSKRHFTGIDIAITAARFLASKPGQKILDIGSGLGKFCFVAGSCTDAIYTGVEYRENFVELSNQLATKHHFKNVSFIHENITDVDFSKYTGFYFFNSFLEQIDNTCVLDEIKEVNEENYFVFSDYMKNEWAKMPIGTRLVCYHTYTSQIPESYTLMETHFDDILKCWEKTTNSISKLT